MIKVSGSCHRQLSQLKLLFQRGAKLWESYGRLIHEGEVTLKTNCTNREQLCYFFLLDKLLIVCKKLVLTDTYYLVVTYQRLLTGAIYLVFTRWYFLSESKPLTHP